MDRLAGQELLDALKNLEGADQASMLGELGYLDDQGKPDFVAFSKALVLAKASTQSKPTDKSQQTTAAIRRYGLDPKIQRIELMDMNWVSINLTMPKSAPSSNCSLVVPMITESNHSGLPSGLKMMR